MENSELQQKADIVNASLGKGEREQNTLKNSNIEKEWKQQQSAQPHPGNDNTPLWANTTQNRDENDGNDALSWN